jgi:hypothetical protein
MAKFQPTGSNAFSYTAEYDPAYPLTDERAESVRIVWLTRYVRDSHLCPNGYKIVNRDVVIHDGESGRIVYEGVCSFD